MRPGSLGAKLLVAAAVLLALLLTCRYWIPRDVCLDGGGAWDEVQDECIPGPLSLGGEGAEFEHMPDPIDAGV